MKQIKYASRACDACGSGNFDVLWTYSTRARTRQETYVWNVSIVVCGECGFTFVSPAPTKEALSEYYADAHEYWREQPLDFSIEKRLKFLRRHVPPDTRPSFIEIGGNASERFRAAMADLFCDYKNVEPNQACSSDLPSLELLPENSAGFIGAYFVLEHVPDPAEFLGLCARGLKKNGMLVLEVPNLYFYPADPAGLYWWEHTNHFSPHSLAALASQKGLELLTVSYQDCSRPFGFAAAFGKTDSGILPLRTAPSERALATACIQEGRQLIDAYHHRLAEARRKIQSVAGKNLPVIIWAANKVCLDLLEGFDLPENALVVDSNPAKKNYLSSHRVFQPDEVKEQLSNAGLFVINTPLHAAGILQDLRQKFGREVQPGELILIDLVSR